MSDENRRLVQFLVVWVGGNVCAHLYFSPVGFIVAVGIAFVCAVIHGRLGRA